MTGTPPALLPGPNGFAAVDAVLTPRQVRQIRRMIGTFGLPDDHGFFASPTHAAGPAACTFDLKVKRLVARRLRAILPGYRPFMVAVTSKGAGSPQTIKFHQDWTYTDERLHRPVFLWCPLVDVDERNGTLQAVPGSHRWTTGIRPSRRVEVTEELQDELAARAVAVPLRSGQALAFDPAVCHGSRPNAQPTPRPAITIALVPNEASLVHFHLRPDGSLVGAEVDDAFFTTNPYASEPSDRPPVAPWDRAITAADLATGMAAEHPRRGIPTR